MVVSGGGGAPRRVPGVDPGDEGSEESTLGRARQRLPGRVGRTARAPHALKGPRGPLPRDDGDATPALHRQVAATVEQLLQPAEENRAGLQ